MNIKLTEQDFIDCDINEQDCVTLKKILVYCQQYSDASKIREYEKHLKQIQTIKIKEK